MILNFSIHGLAIASEIYSPMHELDNHDSSHQRGGHKQGDGWCGVIGGSEIRAHHAKWLVLDFYNN